MAAVKDWSRKPQRGTIEEAELFRVQVIEENYVLNVFGSFDCRFSEQVNHMLSMKKVLYLYGCYEDTKFPLEFILSLNKRYSLS